MTKNQQLTSLVQELKKVSAEKKVNIWKRIAKDLEKPTRIRRIVNLSKINRFTKANDVVVVPGKVLGSGEIDKKLTVAAYQFSGSAEKKIKDAKGNALTLDELAKKNPKGAKVKIIG
ncbi:50S ribosomal protein L18e [Candidatus Woesearchaeota archaeon]|nr:50S ribosomal protein L18e [Candidatus Woesearchaeota archaeon]